MRARAVGIVVVLAGAALAAPPARADIESDYLVCSGTVTPATLSDSTVSSSANTLTCTKFSANGDGGVGLPATWYSGGAESSASNWVRAPHVLHSSGQLAFSVGSQSWRITWDDETVDGVMRFGNGSYQDLVRRVDVSEPPYHIHAGYIRDVDRCADEAQVPTVPTTCLTGPAYDFWFVAERVYDLPV